jgi:hypothetical protein
MLVDDLASQIGALIGTSFLLFYLTNPRKGIEKMKKQQEEQEKIPLRGVRRYSSYHRKKYYAQTSSLSTSQ